MAVRTEQGLYSRQIRLPHHIRVHSPARFSQHDLPPPQVRDQLQLTPVFREMKKDGNAGLRALAYAVAEHDCLHLLASAFEQKLPQLVDAPFCTGPVSLKSYIGRTRESVLQEFNRQHSEFDFLVVSALRRVAASSDQSLALFDKELTPAQVVQVAEKLKFRLKIIAEVPVSTEVYYDDDPLILWWKDTYALLYAPSDPAQFSQLCSLVYGSTQPKTIQKIEKKRKLISIVNVQNQLQTVSSIANLKQQAQVESVCVRKPRARLNKEKSFAQFSNPLEALVDQACYEPSEGQRSTFCSYQLHFQPSQQSVNVLSQTVTATSNNVQSSKEQLFTITSKVPVPRTKLLSATSCFEQTIHAEGQTRKQQFQPTHKQQRPKEQLYTPLQQERFSQHYSMEERGLTCHEQSIRQNETSQFQEPDCQKQLRESGRFPLQQSKISNRQTNLLSSPSKVKNQLQRNKFVARNTNCKSPVKQNKHPDSWNPAKSPSFHFNYSQKNKRQLYRTSFHESPRQLYSARHQNFPGGKRDPSILGRAQNLSPCKQHLIPNYQNLSRRQHIIVHRTPKSPVRNRESLLCGVRRLEPQLQLQETILVPMRVQFSAVRESSPRRQLIPVKPVAGFMLSSTPLFRV